MGTIEYMDGFDDYTAAQATDYGWSAVFNSMQPGRVSGQRMRLSNASPNQTLTPDTQYSAAFAWWTTSAASSFTTLASFMEGTTVHGSLSYNGDGTFSVKNGAGTAFATSSYQGIIANTSYHIEFDYKVDNTYGSYEMRLNGVPIIGPTVGTGGAPVDTNNGGSTISRFRLNAPNGVTGDFDDLMITKGGGFHGDCRIVTQYPNADGANTAWSVVNVTPTWQANATIQASNTTITVPWPTHQPGDIGLLFIETCGGEPVSLTTPSGFVAVANSPQATGSGTAGTQLSVYWCRATSSAMASVVTDDPGDHVMGLIMTFRGCAKSGTPFDTPVGGVKAGASTSVTATGITTTVNNSLVVVAVTQDTDNVGPYFSGWTNAGLASVDERYDGGSTQGNGGGFGIATGIRATAGATGDTTATVSSSINAFLTLALRPDTADYTATNESSLVVGHNSDTDYITSTTAGERETFSFPALGVTGTVVAVSVVNVARKDDAGTRLIAPVVRRSSTNYDGTAVSLADTYAPKQQIYEVDPSTSSAWTVSNLDAGEYGVKVDT